MYDRDRLIELMRRDALQVGDFTLASGRKSKYYVDARKVTLSSSGAALIGYGILDVLSEYDPPGDRLEGVGGLTIGADPIVGATVAIADEIEWGDLDGFIVRKATKDHGTSSLIEGPLKPGSVVAIVDDVATTGGSILRAVDAVEAIGCKVAVVIVVLDRLEGASEAFAARGLEFRSLLTIKDLME